MMRMVANLQKLGIQTNQTQRELVGSLMATGLVPSTAAWARRAVAAGAAYQTEVRGKPGHGLGPPFHHVAAASLEWGSKRA